MDDGSLRGNVSHPGLSTFQKNYTFDYCGILSVLVKVTSRSLVGKDDADSVCSTPKWSK